MLRIFLYLAALGLLVYGSRAALARSGRQPLWPPIWQDLVESALYAAVIAACAFWFVFFSVALVDHFVYRASAFPIPPASPRNAWIFIAGVFAIFFYLLVTMALAVLFGSPAAIASYLILNDWGFLRLMWLPLLGAICAYTVFRSFGFYGDMTKPVGALSAAIAGAAGAYAFGRRMQQKDAGRGYIW